MDFGAKCTIAMSSVIYLLLSGYVFKKFWKLSLNLYLISQNFGLNEVVSISGKDRALDFSVQTIVEIGIIKSLNAAIHYNNWPLLVLNFEFDFQNFN